MNNEIPYVIYGMSFLMTKKESETGIKNPKNETPKTKEHLYHCP
jgi:hypothetical protein